MEDPEFELWLEFEHWQPGPTDDPTEDFFNMLVKLPDGRRYALNVWTFKFIQKARYPWPYVEDAGESEEYLLPPDLFVEQLNRKLMEQVVRQMLERGQMKPEWLCSSEAEADT